MVLYAADLDDIVPTKKVDRKRKEVSTEEAAEKPKKVLSEKQIAALKKGQETRKAKKEQAEKEKADQEALKEKLLAAAPKKRVSKKSAPPTAPPTPVSEPEPSPEPNPELSPEPSPSPSPKAKTVRKKAQKENVVPEETQPIKKRKKQEPPTWFKEYVEGVQKEKAAAQGEVTKKQENIIKSEALRMAKKSWESGYTRDRVQNEVDNHMNRMYSMIFGRG